MEFKNLGYCWSETQLLLVALIYFVENVKHQRHSELVFLLSKLTYGQRHGHVSTTDRIHGIRKWISKSVKSWQDRIRWFENFPTSENGLSVILVLAKVGCFNVANENLDDCPGRHLSLYLLHILKVAWLHFLLTQVIFCSFSDLL